MNYDIVSRGTIQNRDRKRQLIDFSGFQYGKITPSDIDNSFEIDDRFWVFGEFKHRNAPMATGQTLWYTRTVDVIANSTDKRRYAILFVCRHTVDNPEEDIIATETYVARYYWRGAWYTPCKKVTLKEECDTLIKLLLPDKAIEYGLV